jgi:hypothetical protein
MCVILQTWWQLQRTPSSFRYVNSGSGHIQSIYSSAYLGFNIQVNVAPLLLEVSRQFNARYTAFLVPSTAHIIQFTLCVLWPHPYTKYLQLLIVSPQYSTESTCAAIGDMSTIQCALYCKLGAKYSAQPPVLRYLSCGPGHIQCTYSSTYSGFHIQLNVSALLLKISRQFNARYAANLLQNTAHILQFMLCELWSWIYTKYFQLRIFRLQYSAVGICAVIGDISTTQCALYCKLDANTAHNLRFALSELWSLTYTMILQLLIFRLQYSTKRICAAIGNMSTIQCALHCIYCAKYSAHPPVYAIWTVVTDIYNGVTVPHIQASIFN